MYYSKRKFISIRRFLKEYKYLQTFADLDEPQGSIREFLAAVILLSSCHLRELVVFHDKLKKNKVLSKSEKVYYYTERARLKRVLTNAIRMYPYMGMSTDDVFVAKIVKDTLGITLRSPINLGFKI